MSALARGGFRHAYFPGFFTADQSALQMRRAAVSIPANIAEGFRRRGRPDKVRFLNIAEGSVEECRYFLILAKDLGYGDTQKLIAMLEEVSRLLNAYSTAILTPSTHGS